MSYRKSKMAVPYIAQHQSSYQVYTQQGAVTKFSGMFLYIYRSVFLKYLDVAFSLYIPRCIRECMPLKKMNMNI